MPGGVWINRDVVAPYNKEQEVLLWLNDEDGDSENIFARFDDRTALSNHLRGLSTYARFLRFLKTSGQRKDIHYPIQRSASMGKKYIRLRLADASEFMSRKDYTDNWESEMHETFCFWDFEEWKEELIKTGFSIHTASAAYRNEWIATNRWKGKVDLFQLVNDKLVPMEYPVSHMLIMAW